VTGTARIIRADSRALPLADDSVDLVVTSPPYFGLRSYQDGGEHYAGQIGDESTPAGVHRRAARRHPRVHARAQAIRQHVRQPRRPLLPRRAALSRGMTVEDAAWLAGVIDSDGSISVKLNKQKEGRAPSFVPWLRVGQMRPEVVEQIAAVTGFGKAWQDGRGVWNWCAAAQQAAAVLRLIWPWLHIKQRQALASVELARHIAEKRNRGTWSQVSQDDIAYRQSLRDAVLDWNGGRMNDYEPPRLPLPDLPARRTWIPTKSLCLIPERYRIACVDELGLIARAVIVWDKPNGLPESPSPTACAARTRTGSTSRSSPATTPPWTRSGRVRGSHGDPLRPG
jgi:hypothetical protein